MSNLTKTALADAFKAELETKRFDKITIKDIVERAQVNRQTFYYHFQDIYDLLGWILNEEMSACRVDELNFDTWRVQLENIVNRVNDNQVLLTNIFDALDHDYIRQTLGNSVQPSIEKTIINVAGERKLESEDVQFIVHMLTIIIVEYVMEWIESDYELDPIDLIDRADRLFSKALKKALIRA